MWILLRSTGAFPDNRSNSSLSNILRRVASTLSVCCCPWTVCLLRKSWFDVTYRSLYMPYLGIERSRSATEGGRLLSSICITTISVLKSFAARHASMKPSPRSGNKSWICDILLTRSTSVCCTYLIVNKNSFPSMFKFIHNTYRRLNDLRPDNFLLCLSRLPSNSQFLFPYWRFTAIHVSNLLHG